MPIITSFPDPFRTYNRVEVNWADTPSVTAARVLRVNPATGECVPLRPYVCFEGDYLKLSCGHGIFWDTEVPLDTPVYYITEGLGAPCIPSPPFVSVLDTYTRILVDTWGSTDTGQPWDAFTGLTNQYDVTGTEGTITPTAANVNTVITLDGPGPDYEATVTLTTNVIPTGASIGAYGLATRWVDDNNYYRMVANIDTAGLVNAFITRISGGVATILGNVIAPASTISDIKVKASVIGDQLKVKVWNTVNPEPMFWTVEATDGTHATSGRVGVVYRRDTGNLTPLTAGFDDFTVTVDCVPCVPVTAETAESTMPSGGVFRLKDPVRPCNDQAMPLCFTQPNLADIDGTYCIPGQGIFFASMSTEEYAANSLVLNPVNAALPISVSRARRGVSSNLQVVTRTFTDRDALLALNAPGSPILIQAPPAYGIADRYMAISDVTVDRGLTDHRFQVRVIDMPYVQVARPAGPMQGPCGSQMDNLCDIYSTWGELEASGLTWDDLIRGRASTAGGPGPSGIQTWDDVQADFVDWDAVEVGNTWIDIEQGT